MGLGGVVDDGVVAGDDAVQQARVADVAHHELDAVGGEPRYVLRVAGVGQLVQHGDVDLRMVIHHVAHEVAADEAAAAGDDDVLRLEFHGPFQSAHSNAIELQGTTIPFDASSDSLTK